MNFDFLFFRMMQYISEHDANHPRSQSQMRRKVKLFQPCIDAFNRSPGKFMEIILRLKTQVFFFFLHLKEIDADMLRVSCCENASLNENHNYWQSPERFLSPLPNRVN